MSVKPVTNQPGEHYLMRQMGGPAAPPGLDMLVDMDFVRIKQNLEWCEICCCGCCETENSYQICNQNGVKLFDVKEESYICNRYTCRDGRPLDLYVKDESGNVLIRYSRPLRLSCGSCCCCCLQKIEAFAPEDVSLGEVTMTCGVTRTSFDVTDKDGNAALTIDGPCTCCTCCMSCCCGLFAQCDGCRAMGFVIYKDGQQVGQIRKEYSGIAKESMTDSDNFYITFPRELDVGTKIILLGAVFLLRHLRQAKM